MSFIDEAAREINVKIVWYSAAPGAAARLVRYIGERTQPELRRQQRLDIGGGMSVTHLQFVPAALGTIRGFTIRFHLFALEHAGGLVEPGEASILLFRGVDGCVFVGGTGEDQALARVDAATAALGCSGVPIVYGADGATVEEARRRGQALGFPESDAFPLDVSSGAGVFDPFKALARKVLSSLSGHHLATRLTPAPGTTPLEIPAPVDPLEALQRGLDEWQRAFHEKAIWITGQELDRMVPGDVPAALPAHAIHVVRPTTRDGVAVLTNGFSRLAPAPGGQRVELRADASAYGPQIALTLSFLGRLWWVQLRDGGAPWLPHDIVTTAERPIFGVSHFLLAPGGAVHVGPEVVTILRVWPLSVEEHGQLSGKIFGEERLTWLAARGDLPGRWAPLLARQAPFGD
jgi:hypothetical protein